MKMQKAASLCILLQLSLLCCCALSLNTQDPSNVINQNVVVGAPPVPVATAVSNQAPSVNQAPSPSQLVLHFVSPDSDRIPVAPPVPIGNSFKPFPATSLDGTKGMEVFQASPLVDNPGVANMQIGGGGIALGGAGFGAGVAGGQAGQFGAQTGQFGAQTGQFGAQTGQFGAQAAQFGGQFGAQAAQFGGQFGAQAAQFGGQFGAQAAQFGGQVGGIGGGYTNGLASVSHALRILANAAPLNGDNQGNGINLPIGTVDNVRLLDECGQDSDPCHHKKKKDKGEELERKLDAIKEAIAEQSQQIQADNDYARKVREMVARYHHRMDLVERHADKIKSEIKDMFEKRHQLESKLFSLRLKETHAARRQKHNKGEVYSRVVEGFTCPPKDKKTQSHTKIRGCE